jgi:hypothetical protein
MSDTTLERLARAMFRCREDEGGIGGETWSRAGAEERDLYRRMAAAAVEALRQPTPEIEAALTRRWSELQGEEGLGGIPILLWEIVLAEILEEASPKPGMTGLRPEVLPPVPGRRGARRPRRRKTGA